MDGANGGSSIGQVAHEKEHLSANSGLTSQNQLLTAPARLFWVDQSPITSVVSAKFGSVLKGTAGNGTIAQLESIARYISFN